MEHRRRLVRLMLIFYIITSVSATAKAQKQADESFKSLEEYSLKEVSEFSSGFVKSILTKDITFIEENKQIFHTNVLDRIENYVETNDINCSDIKGNIVADFTYPENSSTGDSVMMINAKLNCAGSNYNKMYLFELHIDANGKIYGYNIWVY